MFICKQGPSSQTCVEVDLQPVLLVLQEQNPALHPIPLVKFTVYSKIGITVWLCTIKTFWVTLLERILCMHCN